MKTRHDALLDMIYGAVADPGKWSDTLTRISDHLGAVGGMITYLPERGRPLTIIGRLSAELLEVNQRHYAWNPWSLSMKDVPFEKAVISNSLIDATALPMVHSYGAAIQCERLRAAVFRGERSPLLFGEPEPWMTAIGHGPEKLPVRFTADAGGGA